MFVSCVGNACDMDGFVVTYGGVQVRRGGGGEGWKAKRSPGAPVFIS